MTDIFLSLSSMEGREQIIQYEHHPCPLKVLEKNRFLGRFQLQGGPGVPWLVTHHPSLCLCGFSASLFFCLLKPLCLFLIWIHVTAFISPTWIILDKLLLSRFLTWSYLSHRREYCKSRGLGLRHIFYLTAHGKSLVFSLLFNPISVLVYFHIKLFVS